MLVAILVSSVVMMAVGMLYQTSMVNYNVVRDVRENLYTSTLTSDRITDALRRPNPVEVVVRTDPLFAPHNVITFNFLRGAFQSYVTSCSGIIYYYGEKLYVYENAIGKDTSPPYGDNFTTVIGAANFSKMSHSEVSDWIKITANRSKSEIIGYGVSQFTASKNVWGTVGSVQLSRGTTWTVQYLKAGRG